ncbi:hypothetical protein BDV98DRAFT_561405 [Pterulicium gracile]|uniref:Uncharacterized protein n=1 Tax=Pterulicium gracile TaxID=1884261 RepID=A0A5C3QST8_9AGAR|nr:hypothetical protein BDV98DRAFT_561405 [Pterula gracilis]
MLDCLISPRFLIINNVPLIRFSCSFVSYLICNAIHVMYLCSLVHVVAWVLLCVRTWVLRKNGRLVCEGLMIQHPQ